MTDILYDYALSGSCYKVRLMVALLGVPLEKRAVDFYPGGEHRSPAFRAINPAGTLPVLIGDGQTLTDSAAILIWLARRHDPAGLWYPVDDPARLAQIQGWFALAARLTASVGEARLHDMLRKPLDVTAARAAAKSPLRELEAHLTKVQLRGGHYLLGDTPSVADIACFPYTALAPDGGIPLDPYPAIRDWIFAIRTLPQFVEMPGIHPVHEQLD